MAILTATGVSARPLPHLTGTPRVRIGADPTADLPPRPPQFNEEVLTGAVLQIGEIALLEGDDQIVGSDGSGGFGIFYDNFTQHPTAITGRFYTAFPDAFDEIVVFTTFRDVGSPDATAYAIATTNEIQGLGLRVFDVNASWGSTTTGLLRTFVNMKEVGQYTRLDSLALADPRSTFYPVLGQEFGHRWLCGLKFRDAGGALSSAMLGRDGAHWAANLEAEASVMDGNHWSGDGAGLFTLVEKDQRFSSLDLYAMGLKEPADVPPWFLLRNGVDQADGKALDPLRYWYAVGTKMKATAEPIAISQVIAGSGARVPSVTASPKSFRVAFVLVTRPGERAGEVLADVARLEAARRVWEAKFTEYTAGLGTMCTQLSAPCGAATARITAGTIAEPIEPGRPVRARFTVENDGLVVARNVTVVAESPGLELSPSSRVVDELPPGGKVELSFEATLTGGLERCGAPLTVNARSTVDGNTWKGFAQAVPGVATHYVARFDDGGGFWGANLDGKDTAATPGGFEWGTPQPYYYGNAYYTFQPGAGNGGAGKAWFTDLRRGNLFGDSFGLPVGRSSLWSPMIDLSSVALLRPRLRYHAWMVAIDFSQGAPITADEDHLRLEASNDGIGWVSLDQVDGEDDRWQPREVELSTVAAQGQLRLDQPLRFRFTVNREGERELVEAGLDDFSVLTDTLACHPELGADLGTTPPPPSGGCRVGGAGESAGGGAVALLLVGALLILLHRSKAGATRPAA